jgi:hypothetical protein
VPTTTAVDFTDLDAALGIVQGRAPFADATEATSLLQLSAGHVCTDDDDPPTPVYRPYVVLAHLYWTRWQQFRSLRGASGASLEYSDPGQARDAMLELQRRIDLSLGLCVPSAWPATTGDTFRPTW